MKRLISTGVLPLLVFFVVWGCSSDDPADPGDGGPPPVNTVTCIGCHSSEAALKASLAGTEGSVVQIALAEG
jgi:hypothetical protein